MIRFSEKVFAVDTPEGLKLKIDDICQYHADHNNGKKISRNQFRQVVENSQHFTRHQDINCVIFKSGIKSILKNGTNLPLQLSKEDSPAEEKSILSSASGDSDSLIYEVPGRQEKVRKDIESTCDSEKNDDENPEKMEQISNSIFCDPTKKLKSPVVKFNAPISTAPKTTTPFQSVEISKNAVHRFRKIVKAVLCPKYVFSSDIPSRLDSDYPENYASSTEISHAFLFEKMEKYGFTPNLAPNTWLQKLATSFDTETIFLPTSIIFPWFTKARAHLFETFKTITEKIVHDHFKNLSPTPLKLCHLKAATVTEFSFTKLFTRSFYQAIMLAKPNFKIFETPDSAVVDLLPLDDQQKENLAVFESVHLPTLINNESPTALTKLDISVKDSLKLLTKHCGYHSETELIHRNFASDLYIRDDTIYNRNFPICTSNMVTPDNFSPFGREVITKYWLE